MTIEVQFHPKEFTVVEVKANTTYVDRKTKKTITLRPGVWYVWWEAGELAARRWR